ncbi:MAG: glycosyl hydrolase, partial [Bacteroidota bacterium]
MKNSFCLFLFGLLLSAGYFSAQAQSGPLVSTDKKQAVPAPLSYNENLYSSIKYRLIGPFRGGRSCTVAGVPGNDQLYYFGSVGGGVWRTKDGGMTYENISDGYFGSSIGSIAVSEADPNVIYVGQGEKTVRGNVSSGFGVWKSEDAGSTWQHVGLKDSRHIGRIRIHPTNPDIVYVAAMGDLWKPSEERGVYKTTDGGKSWKRILFANENAGAVDLILDPNNPRVIYASTWNFRRTPYSFSSGGEGSDLWKSTDSGETWEQLTSLPNMPAAPRGIIGVTVSPVNSNRVYALIEAKDGGVFRSDDAGKTWKKVSRNRALRSRAWYYTRIYADTQDEDKVYVMNVSYGISKDAGATWELKNAPHGDHHDLWIDPNNNQRMVIADDGGAQISTDGGDNWTTYYNQPTAQFYRIATDNHFPYRIYGAQQDNSSIRILHRSEGRGISENDWEVTTGGESAYHAVDPKNENIVYGGTYKGYMYRYNHQNKQQRYINVWPFNPAGSGVEVMKYRFNWNFPVLFSQHDDQKLYVFSNHVHLTTNEGQSWQTVSPDLTRNDPLTLKSSGGPITQDNTGVEFYANIFTVMESPHEKGVMWTGSDDGLIHLTRDDCSNWKNVTPPAAPKAIMWNSIDPHPTNPAGAYLAGTMYKSGDYQPYLYKTENYGKSWTKITNGIDALHFTRVVRADPERAGLLYAGTEYGMYVSFDDGASWQPFQLNLPIVPITDLKVKNKNLIVATQGRSFWIIDDLTPMHQLEASVAASDYHLFQPMASYRMRQRGWGRSSKLLEGENHPGGVMIHYFLKEIPDEDSKVSLEILESDGDLIKKYSNTSKDKKSKLKLSQGGNRFVWDMRYPDAVGFDGLVLYASSTRGPLAVPGKYKVKLTVDGESREQEFEILKDPRVESSLDDLHAQFDFLIDVRDKLSAANQAVIDIRKLRKDLDYLKEKLGEETVHTDVLKEIDKLDEQMTIIENQLHETRNEARQDPLNFGIKLNNQFSFLATHESAGDFKPTDQSVALKAELTEQLNRELDGLKKLLDTKLPALNAMISGFEVTGRFVRSQ